MKKHRNAKKRKTPKTLKMSKESRTITGLIDGKVIYRLEIFD